MIRSPNVMVAVLVGLGLLPFGTWAQQSGSRSPTNPQINIYSYGQGSPYGTPYGAPQSYNGINNLPDTDSTGRQDSRLPSDRLLDTMRPSRRY